MSDSRSPFDPPAEFLTPADVPDLGTETGPESGPSVLPVELAHLSWLLGTWVGVGLGQYPGISDFRFAQQARFSTDGRPFLHYVSHSWIIDEDGNRVRPSATETGYLRAAPDNGVEMLLVHPTGFAEIWYGTVTVTGLVNATITGARMELATDGVMRSGTSKEYVSGNRMYGLVDGNLPWAFDMAAMGHPMGNHLAALLRPQGSSDPDAGPLADGAHASGDA